MAESNKILTVSYGTFSCTLEGFDDPFGTMRGIAEYFRDLAADDRYFGAEPPTPDVEMLQNIAQGEVRRRVEARIGDGSVALRQMEGAPSDAETAPEATKAEPAEDVTAEVAEETLEHGPLALNDDYLMSDEPEDVLTVDADAVPVDSGPAESVAEKLRRIRAVVSRTRTPEDEASFSAAPATARRDRALSETIASITADLSDDDDVDVPAPAESLIADTGETKAEIAEDLAADGDFDLTAEDTHEEEFEADAEDMAEDSDGAEDEGTLDEDTPEYNPETLATVMAAASTLPEDGYEEADTDEPLVEEGTENATEDRRVSKPLAPISEDDSGRLMAETDEKLNEDDSIRRRRVISQMRAAVAATKAERSAMGEPASPEERDEAEQSGYRQVLSEVVIPRSQDEEDLAALARAERPAPLVLVSSQRVDNSAPKQGSDVHPARVARADHSQSEEVSGFAAFAAEAGAKELPDLLEAAAAYIAFVKGQPHFSRPEIMRRVARFDPEMNLSREAGLRSFGQLLRQGKIQKLQRGQFTISEDTQYNPAHRIAGE